jgi:hypothetical protein
MTEEQGQAWKQLRSLAEPLRLKVVSDAEGYPVVRGKYGDIEWHHAEGKYLAGYTAGRKDRLGRLLSLPGVIRQQVGDHEVRVLFPVGDLPKVAEVLRARRRRQMSPEHVAALRAGLARHARQAPSAGPESGGGTHAEGHGHVGAWGDRGVREIHPAEASHPDATPAESNRARQRAYRARRAQP